MKSIFSLLFILQAIINDVDLAIAKTTYPDKHACRGGDFKSNTIQKNRDSVFGKIKSSFKNSTYNGFYHSESGDKPEEKVSAILLCPPTILKGLCECCFNKLLPYLLKKCPKQNEGVAWDGHILSDCMLRYTTVRKILSVLDDWAWYNDPDSDYVKAIDLKKTMDSLKSKLMERAAGGGDLRKYASGSAIYDGEENALYLAVMCSPDISKGDCIKCLSKASVEIHSCCIEKTLFYGRVMSTNCYIRYQHTNFLRNPRDGYDFKTCY